jgi:hypothetical protein
MKIGRRRRARSARSSSPLPRIGSDEAVQETTMSYSCSCSASERSSMAAVEAVREPLGALEGAVGDGDARRPLRCEVRRAQLDHLSRADEQHALVLEARENARGELNRGGRHRDALRSHARRRAHLLGDRERALEQLVQHRAERARGFRGARRVLHLAQDLRLAEHHRVEP